MSEPINWRSNRAWPDVDVVMPIRNEAPHLNKALSSVRTQRYPGQMRVFMAVGPSDDGTEGVAKVLADRDPDLTVLTNPSGTIPAALNIAIRAGVAPVVVRVDGHSQLSENYIANAVDTLRRTGAANVGGRQAPVATTPFQHAVVAATTSWLGTGGATYRVGGHEGLVDTVFLGVFDRTAIEAIDLFDENLLRNEDYELNIRLRQAGGTVFFDPSLSVSYSPRRTWSMLARQYFEYGQWKSAVLRMHPDSLRIRQAAAPIGVCAAAISALAAFRRPILGMPAGFYLLATVGTAARGRRPLRTALALATIHISWSLGLICGAARRGNVGQ